MTMAAIVAASSSVGDDPDKGSKNRPPPPPPPLPRFYEQPGISLVRQRRRSRPVYELLRLPPGALCLWTSFRHLRSSARVGKPFLRVLPALGLLGVRGPLPASGLVRCMSFSSCRIISEFLELKLVQIG